MMCLLLSGDADFVLCWSLENHWNSLAIGTLETLLHDGDVKGESPE
jgi:hypothetical protein